MSGGWPIVKLGEVIEQRKEFIRIDDLQKYKRCRVQLHAQGIVLRDEVEGAAIKTKEQQVCRAKELLVAEIDAKVGGFGMVPPELEGAIVSSHYFLFTVNPQRLDHRFLGYYVKTPAFREQVEAQGSTNYAAIRPSHVLGYTLPLPPLAEQRRIVAKIESIAAKIDRAHGLRRQTSPGSDALVYKAAGALFREHQYPSKPLGELLREKSRNGLSRRPKGDPPGMPLLRISAGTSRSDGIVDEEDYKYLEVTDKEQETYLLVPGDLVACRFNGNLHYVGRFSLFAGETGEPRLHPDKLIRFRVDTSQVTPVYVRSVMNSPYGREQIETFCNTTAGNIGISASNLNTVAVPVPRLAEQRRIVEYLGGLQAKVDRLKELQVKTAAELDALLPSILDKAFRGELVQAEPAVSGGVQTAAAGALFPDAVQALEDEYATDLAVAVLTLDDRAQRGRRTREFHQQKAAYLAKVVLRLPVRSTFDAMAAGPWSKDLRQALDAKPARGNWFALLPDPAQRGDVAKPGPAFAQGVQWASSVLGERAGRVRGLLRDIADLGDAKLECWATVLMVAQGLVESGKPATRQAIQHGIDTWPGKRSKGWFSRQDVDNAFDSLSAKGWLPSILNKAFKGTP